MTKKWLLVAAVVALIAVLGFVISRRISARRAAAEMPMETALVRQGGDAGGGRVGCVGSQAGRHPLPPHPDGPPILGAPLEKQRLFLGTERFRLATAWPEGSFSRLEKNNP